MPDAKPLAEILADALAASLALDGTLNDRIAHYWSTARELRPELYAAYEAFLSRIAHTEADAYAAKVGDRMPEFILPDKDGKLVALSELLAKGPLLVSFNRGHWCPFCRIELKGLASISEEVRAAGGSIVSIVPETAAFTKRMSATHGLPFDILTDLDLAYALENGLVVAAGDEIRRLYLGYGLDLARCQGNPAWYLPIPASFILDRDGVVRERLVDPDFRRRMPLSTVVSVMRRLA